MPNVHQYALEPQKTLLYLQDNLENTNYLSTDIYRNTAFEKGFFYTLLREQIPSAQLYGFIYGGVGGGIISKISDIVMEELQKQPELICVFDNVNGPSYSEAYKDGTLLEVDVHYREEIYSIVTAKNSSKSLLDKCFTYSGACWHSLCVLSRVSLPIRKDRSITEAEILAIAEEAYLVIVGAYDGESFVFWKKTDGGSPDLIGK